MSEFIATNSKISEASYAVTGHTASSAVTSVVSYAATKRRRPRSRGLVRRDKTPTGSPARPRPQRWNARTRPPPASRGAEGKGGRISTRPVSPAGRTPLPSPVQRHPSVFLWRVVSGPHAGRGSAGWPCCHGRELVRRLHNTYPRPPRRKQAGSHCTRVHQLLTKRWDCRSANAYF